MKEVKILKLEELRDVSSEFRDEWRDSIYDKLFAKRVRDERSKVEQNLADLLNDGWEIAGTGGEQLFAGFVILVRSGD